MSNASSSGSWKPAGYQCVISCITVPNALKAVDWYVSSLSAEKGRVKVEDGKVVHGEVKIGDSWLFVSDPFENSGCTTTSCSFYVYVSDVDAQYKRAVDGGAVSTMGPFDGFWGDRVASFKDPFSQSWTLATHIKDMTQEEKTQAEKAWKDSCAQKAKENKP